MKRSDLAGAVLAAVVAGLAGQAFAGGHVTHRGAGGMPAPPPHATGAVPHVVTGFTRPTLMAPLQTNEGSSHPYYNDDRRIGSGYGRVNDAGTDYGRYGYAPGMPHLGGGFERHPYGTLEHRYGGGYAPIRFGARPPAAVSRYVPRPRFARRVFTGGGHGYGYGTNYGYGFATYGGGGSFAPTTDYVPTPYDAGYGYDTYGYAPYDGYGGCGACILGGFGTYPYGY